MRSKKTRQLIYFAFFSTIMVVLSTTPLGFVPIGLLRATTLHLPVILSGILFGKRFGAGIGFVFGLLSLAINTFQPTLTSFVFSPFISIGGYSGNLASLIVVFVPRIFLGFISGYLWSFLSAKTNKKVFPLAVLSFGATLLHSALVLAFIAIFFGSAYSEVKGFGIHDLLPFLGGIIATNSLAEAFLASAVIPLLYKALYPILERSSI
ncbi:MAG: ECF transporter S component [Anaerorhabdus sp.]